jgi:hypothetical protein
MNRRTFIGASSAGISLVAISKCIAADRHDASGGQMPTKVPRRLAMSRFGANTTGLQGAIDTGADEVVVDVDVQVTADVTLRSGQTLRFAGGKIVVPRDAKIARGVLYAEKGRDVVLIDPVIDASATPTGVPGIRLIDVSGARIGGGHLSRANLMLESYDNAVDRATHVTGMTIDMNGYLATAVYLSGLRGVTIEKLTCFGGLEGIGIYNAARAIRLVAVTSRAHRQDGFLIYAGQDVSHSDCRAHDNGQSGFTTQRDASGEDSRFASWTGCQSWGNVYDGFDMRGAKERPWKVDSGFRLSRCTTRDNGNCGFYVVMAEDVHLEECTASRNRKQNLFIDNSQKIVVTAFRSSSGAIDVASGPNKAGILVYDSDDVQIRGAISDNAQGPSQDFGVSFTGRNARARLNGGRFSNNRLAPVYAGKEISVEAETGI